MSLKVEQFLDEFFFTESKPKVYTTGAHLLPMRIKRGNEDRFVWVVAEFNDDSYSDDGQLCMPLVYADSLERLVIVDKAD